MITKLQDIDKNRNYTGYYWLSDSTHPVVLDKTMFDPTQYDNSNPFIQEAHFTDGDVSYSIKHFDGIGYVATAVIITELKNPMEYFYIPDPAVIRAGAKIGINIGRLKFIQEWALCPDDLCENMNVLKPARIAFVGFEYQGGKCND